MNLNLRDYVLVSYKHADERLEKINSEMPSSNTACRFDRALKQTGK